MKNVLIVMVLVISCDNCDGDGKRGCSRCDGDGDSCGDCSSSGYVECSNCDGDGNFLVVSVVVTEQQIVMNAPKLL
jgi:hypothetical protein